MTHPVRIGIIGFGYWGPNLTRNFMELPLTELVAVADLNPTAVNTSQTVIRQSKRPKATKIFRRECRRGSDCDPACNPLPDCQGVPRARPSLPDRKTFSPKR